MGSLIPKNDLKDWLDDWAEKYENPDFIVNDPISIPHAYSRPVDREFVGFITASISWGRRLSIINSATRMFSYFGDHPIDDLVDLSDNDINEIKWSHRTFIPIDGCQFLKSLRNYYRENNSLETLFLCKSDENFYNQAIDRFRLIISQDWSDSRTMKHLASPSSGSAAKRIHLFLRWMVRSNSKGVDFGDWTNMDPAKLSCPLDVHTGNIARDLELLKRPYNDSKGLLELDKVLRKLNSNDPVKYDYALFGLGESGILKRSFKI